MRPFTPGTHRNARRPPGQRPGELRRARPVRDVETEEEFCSLLIQIYERHAPTLTTMARGVHELKVERGEYHETNGSCLGVLLHEPFWD